MKKNKYFITLCLLILSSAIFLSCSKKAESLASTSGTDQVSEINVFAAASMTESLQSLSKDFEKQENGKVKVILNFAGSQQLETQIENGAKADIFISASQNYMDKLADKGLVKKSDTLLKNRLAIIKNKNSAFKISGMKDLTASGLKLAVGDKSVPVGSYWEQAVKKAQSDGKITADDKVLFDKNTVTKELNVKDIVSKVLMGEADAGIVYKTDVTTETRGKVEMIDDPLFAALDATYPAAILKSSEDNKDSQKYMDFIKSDTGRKTFEEYGFITK